MKQSLKLQILDFKYMILVYYGIFIILFAAGFILTDSNTNIVSNTGGLEFSSVIVCFVCGICIFREHYYLLAQNGISRKTFAKSSLLTMIIISGILAVISQIITFFLKNFFNTQIFQYQSAIESIYTSLNESVFYRTIANLLFTFSMLSLFFFIGFLIAALFHMANKIFKVVIAAGIPISIFIISPFFIYSFESMRKNGILFILYIFGINSNNPFMATAVFSISSVIVAGIIYLVVKKSEIS